MQNGQKQRLRPAAHPKELPPCRGPKLRAFRHHNSPIEWLERLDTSLEDSDSGRQGYVFKVRIKSELYALKVVGGQFELMIAFTSRTNDLLNTVQILQCRGHEMVLGSLRVRGRSQTPGRASLGPFLRRMPRIRSNKHG